MLDLILKRIKTLTFSGAKPSGPPPGRCPCTPATGPRLLLPRRAPLQLIFAGRARSACLDPLGA